MDDPRAKQMLKDLKQGYGYRVSSATTVVMVAPGDRKETPTIFTEEDLNEMVSRGQLEWVTWEGWTNATEKCLLQVCVVPQSSRAVDKSKL